MFDYTEFRRSILTFELKLDPEEKVEDRDEFLAKDPIKTVTNAVAFLVLCNRNEELGKKFPGLKEKSLKMMASEEDNFPKEKNPFECFNKAVIESDLLFLLQNKEKFQNLTYEEKEKILLKATYKIDIREADIFKLFASLLNKDEVSLFVTRNYSKIKSFLERYGEGLPRAFKVAHMKCEALHNCRGSRLFEDYEFSPQNKEDLKLLLEIASIEFLEYKGDPIFNVTSYKLDPSREDQLQVLTQILKWAAEKDSRSVFANFKSFGLKPPDHLKEIKEIAKIAVANAPENVARFIDNFGLNPNVPAQFDALYEIAEIAAKKWGFFFLSHIKNYGFLSLSPFPADALLKLAGYFKGLNVPGMSINYIKMLKLDVECIDKFDFLVKLIKIAVMIKPQEIAFVNGFGFDLKNREHVKALMEIGDLVKFPFKQSNDIAIYKFCYIQECKFIGEDFLEKEWLKKSVIELLLSDSKVIYEGIDKIESSFSQKNFFSTIFGENFLFWNAFISSKGFRDASVLLDLYKEDRLLFPLINSAKTIDNEIIRDGVLMAIGHFIVKRETFSEAMKKGANDWGAILKEIIEIRDPALRKPLIDAIAPFMGGKVFPLYNVVLENLIRSKNMKEEDAKKLRDDFSKVRNKILKDSEFEKSCLSTCCLVEQESVILGGIVKEIFSKIFLINNRQQMIQKFQLLKSAISLGGGAYLNQETNLEKALVITINNNYPQLKLSEKDEGALQEIFLSSRNPYAFFTYAATLKKHYNFEGLKLGENLSKVFNSVLKGTFKTVRYQTEGNNHLTKINEIAPQVLDLWKKENGEIFDLNSFDISNKGETSTASAMKQIVENSLRDGHLPKDKFSELYSLEAERIEGVKSVVQEKLNMSNDKETRALLGFKLFLFDCLDGSFKDKSKEELQKIVRSIDVQGLDVGEFSNDLRAILSLFDEQRALKNTIFLFNTDDPIEILLAGTDVIGSCQKVDGNPEFNCGLLGYLLNGETRLLSLKLQKEKDAPITARAIIRLLIDSKDAPVMQVERIYPANIREEHRKALIEFAKKEANRLGLPLVSMEEGNKDCPYPGEIKNLRGAVPEYVDANSGLSQGFSSSNFCYVT